MRVLALAPMRGLIFVAMLMLVAPFPAAAQEGPAAPLEHIQYSVTERGRTTDWTAHAHGLITYSQYRGDRETAGTQWEAPPGAFERLAAALHPLENAQGLECPRPVRRAPEAEVSWGRRVRTLSLKLRQGCGGREVGEAFREIIAASPMTGRLIGNDEWEEFTSDAPATIRTPLPAVPAAGAATPAPGSASIDAIAYRGFGPMGADQGQWRIDREGHGSFEYYRSMEPVVIETKTFALGAGGFDQIRTMVSGLENLRTRCSRGFVTDAPFEIWSWIRGDQTTSVRLEGDCMSPAGGEANRIVRSWMLEDWGEDPRGDPHAPGSV